MFWIAGGGVLGKALKKFGDTQPASFLAEQMGHARWAGLHFFDLIFPLFLFIVGTALVFSLTKVVEERGRAFAARRIVVRAFLLFALGVFCTGGFAHGLGGVRWPGVLQRIALVFLGTGLLFLGLKRRGLIVASGVLLLGYWGLLTFAPVPEFGAGDFAEWHNLTNYLDRLLLPGKTYTGDHDPEGLLSTLPAIATGLLGVLAGLHLRRGPAVGHIRGLLIAGVALIGAGWIWSGSFPVIKQLWTSSYVLVAGGWSALLLGAFYWLVEVRGWQRWAAPFVWIGEIPSRFICSASSSICPNSPSVSPAAAWKKISTRRSTPASANCSPRLWR